MSDQREIWEEEYNIENHISLEKFKEESLKYQLEFMKEELQPDPLVQKLIQEAKSK